MAKTILESFRELRSNLEITLPQQSTISTRQQNVRKAVEEDMEVLSSFLTGSYSRHTMIAPLKKSDIDVFTVLNPSYYYDLDGPTSLLDKVKRVLKKTYPNTPDISRNGQAVTIQFTDFMVDVVPGFDRKGGGYLIPNSITGKWISTDPKKHVEIIANANSIHNNNLVPLIKMTKGWNKNINTYFQSFHLEVLSLLILDNVKISNFPSGMRYFFDKGRNLISKKNPDPAGYGEDVGVYINTQEKIQEAAAKFQLAYDRAIKAEDYERQGYIEDAIKMWKIIFGDYFPAYG